MSHSKVGRDILPGKALDGPEGTEGKYSFLDNIAAWALQANNEDERAPITSVA
jgi:hypothetical protein